MVGVVVGVGVSVGVGVGVRVGVAVAVLVAVGVGVTLGVGVGVAKRLCTAAQPVAPIKTKINVKEIKNFVQRLIFPPNF